jgi:signal transduction histidine kinase
MMEPERNTRERLPALLLLVGSVASVLALALVIFYGLVQPPMEDLVVLAAILSVAAVLAIGLGHSASRLGWTHRFPRLHWTLIAGNALTLALVFLSVWLTMQLMFVNAHDLALATVLLIFAAGIATSLGYFLTMSLAQRITELNQAAKEIARGHLDTRAPVRGRDELAELAQAFNEMAAELETAEHEQRELEMLRRDLVAWVGHDLRTPLTSLRAVVEALADGVVEDPATVQRYLRTAQLHVRSLSDLLDDLSDVAQIDTGGMRLDRHRGSIRDLISDTLESFSARAAQEGVRLEGSTEPDVDPISIDSQKIERVLSNLLDNAIRHTPPGGAVQVNASAAEDEVRVEVSDTGEGIKADDLPRVFGHFYRGEEDRRRRAGSAGLGLSIAKGFVEAHGGHVGIESAVGEGTTVWFTLPR